MRYFSRYWRSESTSRHSSEADIASFALLSFLILLGSMLPIYTIEIREGNI